MSLSQVVQYLFTNNPAGIIISITSLSPLLVALSLALPVVLLFVSIIILPSLLLLLLSLPLLGITVLDHGTGKHHLRRIFLDFQEAYRRQNKAQYNTTSHICCYYCHDHYHHTTTTTTRTISSLTRCLPLLLLLTLLLPALLRPLIQAELQVQYQNFLGALRSIRAPPARL